MKNQMMVVVYCHYGHTGLCRFTVIFCILIIMLFFATWMSGACSDSHALASLCVHMWPLFLHCSLIFPPMKSAHFFLVPLFLVFSSTAAWSCPSPPQRWFPFGSSLGSVLVPQLLIYRGSVCYFVLFQLYSSLPLLP